MSGKLSKDLVLYIHHPETPTYQCKVCCYFKDGLCSYFEKGKDKVKEIGSCNLWSYSEHYVQGPKDRLPSDSGYTENRPGFSCGRCDFFVSDTKMCREVEGKISALACCNNWEKAVTPRGDMSEKELRSMANFKS